MSDKFQPIDRDSLYLLVPSIQEWRPEAHPARFVIGIADQLGLRALAACYGGGGKPPCHPALLLCLLFYDYATGVFSSRKPTCLPRAGASQHQAMSWGYAQKLEAQMRGEVKALLKRAEEVDEQAAPEIDMPAERVRREQRLAAIKRAREEIKRRARARFKAEYEAKLKARREQQAKSGKKARGREPKPPEEGPRDRGRGGADP